MHGEVLICTKVTMKIAIIHGPNLNLLGKRERSMYGEKTLDDLNSWLKTEASCRGIELSIYQSNEEGKIVDMIHDLSDKVDGIIINPAAYSHTSVAIRDAISSLDIPTIEVHISNIYGREEFRHVSLISPVVSGIVVGMGDIGYAVAIEAIRRMIERGR
jgi:3-dehydroquinate dehydratase-2